MFYNNRNDFSPIQPQMPSPGVLPSPIPPLRESVNWWQRHPILSRGIQSGIANMNTIAFMKYGPEILPNMRNTPMFREEYERVNIPGFYHKYSVEGYIENKLNESPYQQQRFSRRYVTYFASNASPGGLAPSGSGSGPLNSSGQIPDGNTPPMNNQPLKTNTSQPPLQPPKPPTQGNKDNAGVTQQDIEKQYKSDTKKERSAVNKEIENKGDHLVSNANHNLNQNALNNQDSTRNARQAADNTLPPPQNQNSSQGSSALDQLLGTT